MENGWIQAPGRFGFEASSRRSRRRDRLEGRFGFRFRFGFGFGRRVMLLHASVETDIPEQSE